MVAIDSNKHKKTIVFCLFTIYFQYVINIYKMFIHHQLENEILKLGKMSAIPQYLKLLTSEFLRENWMSLMMTTKVVVVILT